MPVCSETGILLIKGILSTGEIVDRNTALKNSNPGRFVAWLILLTVPAALMLLLEYRVVGELGHQFPDARVYLSIADNFISTGHFIQTARGVEGMVVPPGVPFVLTLLRFFRFSNRMLLGVHALLFGVSNILLYETERRITGKGIWAPILYTMANLRCLIILGNTLVEHYFLFLLCLSVWIAYSEMPPEKKLICLNLTGLALLMIRPLLSVVYLPILVYSLIWSCKNRKTALVAGLVLLPAIVLGLNLAVNYRETGEFILLENYSGSDLYTATSYDAPVHTEDANTYSDETLYAISHDASLTMQQRNRLLKEHAREALRDHPGRVLRNGLLRGYELFLKVYVWATLYVLAGGVLLALEEYRQGKLRSAAILALALALVAASSFGVPDRRYSIVIWPAASVHGAYLTHRIWNAVFRPRLPE